MSKYAHDQKIATLYVYEATFLRKDLPGCPITTNFAAEFAEDVVTHLNNVGFAVTSVRNIGMVNVLRSAVN